MKLEPGTKFKLECVVDEHGYVRASGGDPQVDGHWSRHISFDEHPMPADNLHDSAISDIRKPRGRWTDPAGNVYEILQAGDVLKHGDLFCWRFQGLRVTDRGGQVIDNHDSGVCYLRLVRP